MWSFWSSSFNALAHLETAYYTSSFSVISYSFKTWQAKISANSRRLEAKLSESRSHLTNRLCNDRRVHSLAGKIILALQSTTRPSGGAWEGKLANAVLHLQYVFLLLTKQFLRTKCTKPVQKPRWFCRRRGTFDIWFSTQVASTLCCWARRSTSV